MKNSVTTGARILAGDCFYRPTASVPVDVVRDLDGRRAEVARGRRCSPTSKLSPAALAFRAFHAAIAVEQLLAIGYVWWCALTDRRGHLLHIAVATLLSEGVLVTANGGDCPLGGLQERLDDSVPLFELVLSPRAAKRAVPFLPSRARRLFDLYGVEKYLRVKRDAIAPEAAVA